MHAAVGCTKFVAKKIVLAAFEVGHLSACHLYKKCACGNIPRVEVIFKETFQSSASNIGKIYSSATEAANAVGLIQEYPDDLQVGIHFIKHIVGKTGGKQAAAETTDLRHFDRIAIHESTSVQ
jgi:hypothetical protein